MSRALTSQVKDALNALLRPLNLRVETRTAEDRETARRAALAAAGHFEKPAFPVLEQFLACRPAPIIAALREYRECIDRLSESRDGYSFDNDYFASPDAEVAYGLVRRQRPARILEIGSGHSTSLFRAAIRDAGLTTQLTAIDPSPRRAVEEFANHIIRQRVEDVPKAMFAELSENDILFVDSSHRIDVGNDVILLILTIIPKLRPGVVVHLHDIFLPWDYPRHWIIDNRWEVTEQYLVQALLQGSCQFEVLWPGYFLQRTDPEFPKLFDVTRMRVGSSLWLRKVE